MALCRKVWKSRLSWCDIQVLQCPEQNWCLQEGNSGGWVAVKEGELLTSEGRESWVPQSGISILHQSEWGNEMELKLFPKQLFTWYCGIYTCSLMCINWGLLFCSLEERVWENIIKIWVLGQKIGDMFSTSSSTCKDSNLYCPFLIFAETFRQQ